ncbi:MAG TPA: hypothetical protein VFQ04_11060, partial [Actinomycetes bacterium]|nr:hypothetical protein [Actinomycetes bacterium]
MPEGGGAAGPDDHGRRPAWGRHGGFPPGGSRRHPPGGQRAGRRPPWWPEGEPFPPPWRGGPRRFPRRVGLLVA